ncbi:MAG: alpha-2-macroglobulin family protein [Gammaproteobacteria bacterium]
MRFYSDYLPAGRYHLSYTAQAIAPGEFARRPARAEEMYDPDVYGRTASGKLIVETD